MAQLKTIDGDIYTVHHKPEAEHEFVQVHVQRTEGEREVVLFHLLPYEAVALARKLERVAEAAYDAANSPNGG